MDLICNTCGSTANVYRLEAILQDGVTRQVTQPLCPYHRLAVRRQLEKLQVQSIDVLMDET